MGEHEAAQMAAYRKEKFAVKVEPHKPEPFAESEMVLEMTFNGYQWTRIGLTKDEAMVVIAKLAAFLAKGAAK